MKQSFLEKLADSPIHAYILQGKQGSGKFDFAIQMAGALLHTEKKAVLNHPDCVVVESQKKSIGVDDIRELKRELSTRPFQAALRVILIPDAHRMTVQAQNSFLKTLEEPNDAVFILLCEQEMLETIQSRCVRLDMGRKSRAELQQRLVEEGVERERATLAAALGDGLYGRALAFATDDGLCQLRRDTIDGVRRLFSKQPARAAYAEFLKSNKEQIEDILDILLSFFRDSLVVRCGAEEIFNLDYRESIEGSARYFTSGELRGIIEYIVQTKKQLTSNVNLGLAIENMLLGMMEVKAR